jgi:hypothetical protein
MARLTVNLLGPFQVTLDGQLVTAFESDKVRALLAYLAVELYALVIRYPHAANSKWYENVAATLLSGVVAAAQERGRARGLWVTAEELLQELGRDDYADLGTRGRTGDVG